MSVEDSEAQKYIADLNKTAAALCMQVHEMFLAAGCNSYVKTIYIGYDTMERWWRPCMGMLTMLRWLWH
jgi:hypothetical protein